MTGEERVLDYMLHNSSISSKEAIDELGETRLSARIHELKNQGYPIKDKWADCVNRWGKTVHFKRYYLEQENSNG